MASFSVLDSPALDGDHDWMDPEGGKESVERLRQAGNGFGRMYMIPHAGHHGELTSHTQSALFSFPVLVSSVP